MVLGRGTEKEGRGGWRKSYSQVTFATALGKGRKTGVFRVGEQRVLER